MRVLVLTERYPPDILGGYEIACATVADGLRRRGHDVVVLTSNFGLQHGGADEQGARRTLHYAQDAPSLLRLARWEMADCRALRDVISSWKPDVIYAWSMLHLFPSLHRALGEANVPVVLNIQDTWLPRHLAEAERLRSVWLRPGTNTTKRAGKAIIRKVLRLLHPEWLRPLTAEDLPLDNVIFCSRFQRAEHERLGMPLGASTVIYNGIDTNIFTGGSSREAGGPLRVLFVGRLVAEKGAHTAIEAVAHLHRRGCRQITLSIAGVPCHPWEYATMLRQAVQAEGLGECVRFLGQVSHDSLPEIYRQHDVLVFPSSHKEGLPMTLIEAMACGLAVVGTTTGGSAEVLQDSVTGLTFPSEDAAALADCLLRLLNDSALSRSLAATGQRLVREKFGIETAVAQTEGFLREVWSSHSRRHESQRHLEGVAGGAR
jgi:glycosyltransferase involved in cell wall biosynthesis